ncbi:MAG TPA: type II CRISPR RNA-guided endonuclease Cas9, partial [Anaerolineae bacterium]|nr:type II CRISPR RNA-guided endonuclease Cas9 [Anaerolineae bacterium]
NGETKKEYLKTIPKSNPLYQEFRIWQWIKNLSIYDKIDDKNVTANFVDSIEGNEKLFEFLNSRKKIDQKSLLKYLIDQKLPKLKSKELNAEIEKYRWNFVEDKEYPCNETRNVIASRLEKVSNISSNFLTQDIEQHLWHIIYSITDKIDYEKALKSFAKKHNLDQASFVENFKKIPPFDSEYGAYSEKAIKKLLPLLRIGKYWSWEKIDSKTKERIEKMLTGEFDDFIKTQVREKAIHLTKENQFQGLPLWLASYIIYDRHSEAESISQWKSVNELEHYLKEFKQHSLRNPIVEQVITETLRVVKDIWKKYGNGTQGFFDEIHIELGREMKQTAEQRKSDTYKITENENTNLRIKALIMELRENSDNKLVVDNVRPYSPTQQEALKIYEDGVLNSNIEIPEDILKISKSAQPTKNELTRYKLWLEQKYRSPYTGESIPLSKLFTSDYEIEHIIPQSRYFDDSFNNKVICESVVNKQKDNQLGLEFIKHHSGEILTSNFGKKIKILTEEEYVSFVKEHYSKNHRKRNNLLLEDIPDKMIERQLNDTRYISKFIMSLLSNIVRENINDDGINSKNIIPCNGKITSQLKQDWGLNDVWNELILPRFERLNTLTNSQSFTSKNSNGKIIPVVPFELSKGFQKKRIDHRHHALDALVIACTTRDHVNLLNNQSAKSDTKRYDLQHKLRNKEKWLDNNYKERDKFTTFKKPWINFTEEAKNRLEKVVVSFKQNLRVINKATNFYEKIQDGKKIKVAQKGVNWAIRKQMHEATVSGIVNLPWVKLGKGEITTATRERNDLVSIFKDITTKEKAESKIKKITDTGIQKILLNYLDSKGNKPEAAFSPEGIEELNNDIAKFNKGKFHQPIFKVRLYEKGSGRFKLGVKGNNKDKYVQGAPNLFFGIYLDLGGNRSFETISLDKVVERQKQKLSPVPEKKVIEVKKKNEKEIHELKLENYLSPDDCIYIPTDDEKENIHDIDFNNLTNEQLNKIFFVNDFSGTTCYFRPNRIAKAIAPKEIDMNFEEEKNKLMGSFDTKTASFEGKQIKDRCIKLKVNRLGDISLA